MAQTSWPFENVDTSETQFSQFFRTLQDTGVVGVPGGTNLLVSGDNSGLQVRVAAGQAVVRGFFYDSTAQETIAITAVGTNTRIDAIVLELDPTANSILLKAVAGTAVASSPVAPTLTQSSTGVYQMLLGYVTIPNNATSITSGMVSDNRTFVGNRLGAWTTATRPATPFVSQTGYNFTLGYHEFYTGSTWSPLGVSSDPSPFMLMGA